MAARSIRGVQAAAFVAAALSGCDAPPRAEGSATLATGQAAPGSSTSVTAPRPSVSAASTVPRPTTPAKGAVSFLAVGDIMLSRKTAAAIDQAHDPLLPFRGFAEVFRSVDFTFGNLECMFSASDTYSTGPAQMFNTPKGNVAGLKEHRFAVLNLANNHAFDQGEEGIRITLALLRHEGLKTVGLGMTEAEAFEPAIHEVRGVRIGFVGVSYSSVNDNSKTWLPYVARLQQVARWRRAIQQARERADFVVATMHAGVEYIATALDGQKLVAHAMIDAGADILIAHHPHVVQDVEVYQGHYIFYSLGNFIFDHTAPHTNEGAALRIALQKSSSGATDIVRLEVLPYVIENLATPRPANDEIAAAILGRMKLKHRVLIGRTR